MEFVRFLLTGGLIIIGARIVLTDENSKNDFDLSVKDRLPNYIKPVHYDIELTMKQNVNGSFTFFGDCKINISIDLPTRNISLHAQQLRIASYQISLSAEHLSLDFSNIIESYMHNYKNHILTIQLSTTIPSGFYVLTIIYDSFGDSSNKGFFNTSYVNEKGNRRWFAVTNFYPIGARQVFPCWDEPAIRVHFNISIKHHRNYTVLSNMPTKKISSLEDDMVLTHFHTTPAISTYQIAIAMFDSAICIKNTWCRRYAITTNLAVNIFHEVTKLGSKWEFHNLTDVQNIAIPGFHFDGVVHWKLIFYRETDITYCDKIDPAGRKINVARLIARSVAYQWFSKMVSPSWWSYSWLNEGIAMVLGLDAIDKVLPDYKMLSIMQIKQESLRLDTQSVMKPLISQINIPSEINSFFSFSYYVKAPAILHMLKQMVTKGTFLNGLHNYLKRHMYGSATVNDFWTAMQDALNKPQKSEFDLKKILSAWIYHAHYPVLNMIKKNYANKTIALMRQKNVNRTDLTKWYLPVTCTTQQYSDFHKISLENTLTNKTLSSMNKIVFINSSAEDDWIIANLQQIGYYRVNYDTGNWIKIATYLNSKEYTKLHVLNRAQIIDDAYHFVVTDELSLITFLELVDYLKQETNYIAWYPMIKIIEDMSCLFPFQESAYIKNKMRLILDGLLEKIGYEENSNKDDISNSLRQEAAKWACILDSDICKTQAVLKLQFHLANNKSILLPYWKQWTYCNGFKDYSSSFKVFNNSKGEYDTIKKFVVCCDVIVIFNYLTSENYNKSQNINIFLSIVARHAKNDFMLGYILTNFEQIKPREVSTIALFINIINHVYSKEQLNEITAFVENLDKKIEMFVSVNKILFDHNMWYAQVNECMKKVRNIILLLKRKIETRLSEIKSQIDRYNKFIAVK